MTGSNFVLQNDFKVDYAPCHIKSWRSSKTGLQAVLVNKQSPIVNGYFAVGSEIHDDSGCPHTLEHLIFMGSKKYPYKGLLDTLGNKCMSTTNAWTATDQTVYTLDTAGWEGFKTLLPIYIDHVLNPTLTDSACLTEVYHIDGKGEEKGVVFSEMQAAENTSDSLTELNSRKLLYGSSSAYASETGGLQSALRVLKNDQIRDFHNKIYRSDNLSIIVTGSVDSDEFLSVLDLIDSSINPPSPDNKRPFVDTPADRLLEKSVSEVIEFPDTDETMGELLITWDGPDCHDSINNIAVDVLLTYLTEDSTGKLSKEIVDLPEPLATSVDYYTNDFIKTGLVLMVSGVPSDDLSKVREKVAKALEQQINPLVFDLKLIRESLDRLKYQLIMRAESKASYFTDVAISSFLYGSRDGKDLQRWLSLDDFDLLSSWPAEKWIEVLQKFIVGRPSVTVLGTPSSSLYKKLKVENSERIQHYKKVYGKEGLKKLNDNLDNAQRENNKPIPPELMAQFPSPSISHIQFIKTTAASAGQKDIVDNNPIQDLVSNDSPKNFPLYIHFEHFDSQFATIQVLLSSFVVEERLLPYIDIIFTELLALPMVLDDGTKLTYEQVVAEINKDILQLDVSTGYYGAFDEIVALNFRFKASNYPIAIEWIRRAFWNTKFDQDRLKVIAEKHINTLPERKRSGLEILGSSISRTLFTKRSLKRSTDILESEEFAHQLAQNISGNFKVVNQDLEDIRSQLFSVSNMRIFISGNIENLENPVSSWKSFVQGKPSKNPLVKIPRSLDVRSASGRELAHHAYINPVPGTESSYLRVISKGPVDYLDKDIPALSLCCEYLQVVEGPLWRGIRGTGLAYGTFISRNIETGQLVFEIYAGTDVGKALSVTEKIISDFIDGTTPFEDHLIEGAVSSIVNSIAGGRSNYNSATVAKFIDLVLRDRGSEYLSNYFEALSRVSKDDLLHAMKKYLLPWFSPESSMIFTACHPSKNEGLKELFTENGYHVTVHHLADVDAGTSEYDSESEEEDEDEEEEEEDEENDHENHK